MALQVLGMPYPGFDLPAGERFTAAFPGDTSKWSKHLYRGLAEAMAVMATRDAPREEMGVPVGLGNVADRLVRELLNTTAL